MDELHSINSKTILMKVYDLIDDDDDKLFATLAAVKTILRAHGLNNLDDIDAVTLDTSELIYNQLKDGIERKNGERNED